MTTATQREALESLSELCELSADVRLGQLLAHLGFLGEDETGRSLWDIQDEQLPAVMHRHRAELAGRTAGITTHRASQRAARDPYPQCMPEALMMMGGRSG